MIIVKTIEEFQSFVDTMERKNIPYTIVGNEHEGVYGTLNRSEKDRPNIYSFTFLLMSAVGEVFVRSYVRIGQKEEIQSLTAKYDYTVFEKIYIEEKGGNLHCSN